MSTVEEEQTGSLDSLALSDSVYNGFDHEGRLRFRDDLHFTSALGKKPLLGTHLTAMGLTDTCCKLGRGKVSLYRKSL